MADKTVTAASVVPGANALIKQGTAGATITAGQAVYLDATDGKLKLADANASPATADCVGISLHGASANQPLKYVYEDDDFTHGLATVAAGEILILSGTAGGIAPAADALSGIITTVLGVGKSSTKMFVKLVKAKVAVP